MRGGIQTEKDRRYEITENIPAYTLRIVRYGSSLIDVTFDFEKTGRGRGVGPKHGNYGSMRLTLSRRECEVLIQALGLTLCHAVAPKLEFRVEEPPATDKKS
jgi:hypothetical protein